MIKVIAFDLFGTVFDLSTTPKEEIKDYINQVKREVWEPLKLPSSWANIPLFEDSKTGLKKLKRHYKIVTCSNAPINLQFDMMDGELVQLWDGFTDFSGVKAYKPDPKTYSLVYKDMWVKPEQCLMVTGNEGSPDLKGAKDVGMQSIGIRKAGSIKNIIELAEVLGC
jgi:HAD superfamily hydrolase (TIGR01493 family)